MLLIAAVYTVSLCMLLASEFQSMYILFLSVLILQTLYLLLSNIYFSSNFVYLIGACLVSCL